MPHAPPVVRLALAFVAGAGWGISGAPIWTALLVFPVLLRPPNPPWTGPGPRAWLLVVLIGFAWARGGASQAECILPPPGTEATITGRFLASPRGGSAPFLPIRGCTALTVVTSDTAVVAADLVSLEGTWTAGRRRSWFRALRVRGPTDADLGAGSRPRGAAEPIGTVRWGAVRWRDGLVRRADRLYGDRGPLVAALTLARREGMDRGLSDGFARTGIAHLLAISGFHVGVIAGAAFALIRLLGVGRRTAGLGAAGMAWAYVALIGFPSAASRAALILGMTAAARSRGRPPARWGALASALLLLVWVGPTSVAQPGFQLSFVGAAGLVAWGRPMADAVARAVRGRLPRSACSSVGAALAATLATLPVVAWHFERVSLIGIPATLVATPLVAVALPGAIATLLLDPIAPGVAQFLAGGVDGLLALLEGGTAWAARWRWASLWTSRPSVVAGLVGCAIGTWLARLPGVGARGRRLLVASYAVAALIAWPPLVGLRARGALEMIVLDVGQGDAIALRSPRGRWMLVDAGPPLRGAESDWGAHPVVRALRARGVRRLEYLFLTHPDLDHIGGAQAVLRSFDVGAVYDPALPAGKRDYLGVLSAAEAAAAPWRAARTGQLLPFDGVTIEVLHPDDPLAEGTEANEASVVLKVSYGSFDALLTGDAYKETERALADVVGDIEVLKIGHHGSDTSTDSVLLARTRPEVAIVSVGRANRYGHPTPEVLARLRAASISLHRTDLDGSTTVTVDRAGRFRVRTERAVRDVGPEQNGRR